VKLKIGPNKEEVPFLSHEKKHSVLEEDCDSIDASTRNANR
jgi:hypothetical protein